MTHDPHSIETDQPMHDDPAAHTFNDSHHDDSFMTDTHLPDLLDCGHHGHKSLYEEHRAIIGTPDSDAQHWEHQTTEFSCAVEAQRGIIESLTGQPVSEAQLCTEAAERGWLTSADGTTLEDTGKLLELHGVETHREMDATLGDIYQELALGHKVIVGVKAEDLWEPENPFNDLCGQGANHAIWVTGIDKTDPNDIKIIINDSGDPDGAGKEYHLNEFMDAWEQSGYFYLATDKAPPDLHGYVPEFDPDQLVFPDMIDWLHDHLPDSQTLLADMMVLSGMMDIASRLGGAKNTQVNSWMISNIRDKQPASKPAEAQTTVSTEVHNSSAQEKAEVYDGKGHIKTPLMAKDEQQAAPLQGPSKPAAHTGQNFADTIASGPKSSLTDSIKNKILDNQRAREAQKESSEDAGQQTAITSTENPGNKLRVNRLDDAKEFENVIFIKRN